MGLYQIVTSAALFVQTLIFLQCLGQVFENFDAFQMKFLSISAHLKFRIGIIFLKPSLFMKIIQKTKFNLYFKIQQKKKIKSITTTTQFKISKKNVLIIKFTKKPPYLVWLLVLNSQYTLADQAAS